MSQVTIFKQKYYVEKIISKGKHCINSSGDRESCIKLQCEISSIKGDHVLDEYSISSIFSLADTEDSCRVTMGTSVYGVFCSHTSKAFTVMDRLKIKCMQ